MKLRLLLASIALLRFCPVEGEFTLTKEPVSFEDAIAHCLQLGYQLVEATTNEIKAELRNYGIRAKPQDCFTNSQTLIFEFRLF